MRFIHLIYLVLAAALPVQAVQYAPAEILVRMRPTAAKANAVAQSQWQALNRQYGLYEQQEIFAQNYGRRSKVAKEQTLLRWRRLRLASSVDPVEIARQYQNLTMIEYAQPNYLRRPAYTPDDSLYAQQWNLPAMGWAVQSQDGAAGIIVAVIDSGLDFDHPDIADQVWRNRSEEQGVAGIDDDGNGYVDDILGWDFSDAPGLPGLGDYLEPDNDPHDESGHGTHVAGTVAASVDNGRGIAGIAPGVQLMAVRAGFNLPSGGFLEDDDLAAAIIYAVENGADIINMSWGDPNFSPLLKDAVRFAAEAGCVMVAASGNEGESEVFVPARFDETIAVTASDAQNRILAFSNTGPSIDLAAPGLGILSLTPGGGYGERSGTSMAAAQVSGIAALVLGRQPLLTPAQVKAALSVTAADVGPAGWDMFAGMGIVQAAARQVERPPILRLEMPQNDAVVGDSVLVQFQLAGEQLSDLELSWGRGPAPLSWNTLYRVALPAAGRVEVIWPTAALAEAQYLLRLRVNWAGRVVEERSSVQVRRRGPRLSQVRLSRVLDGPIWQYLVEWDTDVAASAVVRIADQDTGTLVAEVAAEPRVTQQQVRLPLQLEPGVYQLSLLAWAGAAQSEAEIGTYELQDGLIPKWNLVGVGEVPDGYLMPSLSDLDNDGRAELVQMPFGGRNFYNTGDFYEFQNGFERVHSTNQLFIPWNVHDLDGDGRFELMAVDAQRVRLLEAAEPDGFPTRSIWEQSGVWGGEVADLDGDGLDEIFLRSGQAQLFKVFETVGDDLFAEIAALVNPTAGANDLGERQVVGDLDGDGQGELLTGDSDGDLFIYEAIGDNAYRLSWSAQLESDDLDGRVIGGGVDVDGDGRVEFMVAHLSENVFAPRRTRWLVTVYEASGDNSYAPEWQVEVLGGKSSGNGISSADIDGDGTAELIVALVPHLYVFSAVGANSYAPVWYAEISDTHRPAVGDLNGDGLVDLAFNGAEQVQVVTLQTTPGGRVGLSGFVARAEDLQHIALQWEAIPGVEAYRVYRDDEILDTVEQTLFVDTVSPERFYRYYVVALDSSGQIEGARSPTQEVQSQMPPEIVAVERFSSHQLALRFSAAMQVEPVQDIRNFHLEPGLGNPSSAIIDQTGWRAVLGFVAALPDSGNFTLLTQGLADDKGTPLALASRAVDFALTPLLEKTRILGVDVLSPTQIAVNFSGAVSLQGDGKAAFVFVAGDVQIETVDLRDATSVVLELDSNTPLKPLGQRYVIRLDGLLDAAGQRVDGQVFVEYAAPILAEVTVFPNPYLPGQGGLTFAGLTVDAEVRIFDLKGQLVQVLLEEDGNGGVQWTGSNVAGKAVESGVYLYQVRSGLQVRKGKFALIRD